MHPRQHNFQHFGSVFNRIAQATTGLDLVGSLCLLPYQQDRSSPTPKPSKEGAGLQGLFSALAKQPPPIPLSIPAIY